MTFVDALIHAINTAACFGVHWYRTIFQKTDNYLPSYVHSVFLEGKAR
jgi:hypothetical protein